MLTNFQITVLASGSKGNASLIRAGDTAILIDAGISCRRIEQGLAGCGLTPEDLSGVFLTHEHSDHIAGLEVFARKFEQVPIFANEKTWLQLPLRRRLLRSQLRVIPRGCTLGSLRIESFRIPHDAADPVGYKIYYGDEKCTYLTDCGYVSKDCERAVDGAEVLILEANHDEEMLRHGPYPAALKARISGRQGHLSNRLAGQLLTGLDRLPRIVFLAHLSETNNTPETALNTVKAELGNAARTKNMAIYVASPRIPVSNFRRRKRK
jgi:phosphoribosyl 1,2-cyclic phosphodiesterase